jgi:Zn finger protein HypA/HybF involved in hydrogenase expression
MITILNKLDEIIEDPQKTKAVLRWLEQHGMLDETMIAMWEIEQNNKECVCKHCYPGGESALTDAVGLTSCALCGADDYPGNTL